MPGATTKYRVVSQHPEVLADGRMVAPYDEVKGVDLDEPHNQMLVDEGLIIPIETPSRAAAKKED